MDNGEILAKLGIIEVATREIKQIDTNMTNLIGSLGNCSLHVAS